MAPKGAQPRRAAQYVRMSTEHQRYSTENQSDAIAHYAAQRGVEIVRTYSDEGKSGLRIQGRDGLKQLIEDIQSGKADFEAVLVYDISRWGRFQDADESAYYEYICKRAGISVIYCAEQFENDGSPVSTIVKGVKRAMAGEYSRELSQKVFTGQSRLIELGYRQGGPPGFGLRRMLIDEHGVTKGILERGQHKSIQTDRVTLVPGPAESPKGSGGAMTSAPAFSFDLTVEDMSGQTGPRYFIPKEFTGNRSVITDNTNQLASDARRPCQGVTMLNQNSKLSSSPRNSVTRAWSPEIVTS
jgi:DNA invertase Pin-like site-specific DNA recombinase